MLMIWIAALAAVAVVCLLVLHYLEARALHRALRGLAAHQVARAEAETKRTCWIEADRIAERQAELAREAEFSTRLFGTLAQLHDMLGEMVDQRLDRPSDVEGHRTNIVPRSNKETLEEAAVRIGALPAREVDRPTPTPVSPLRKAPNVACQTCASRGVVATREGRRPCSVCDGTGYVVARHQPAAVQP
jgi:hypothetical protein